MYLNKAFIIGNLTRDPELKALPSGLKVCSFGVATNHTYKDKEGNRKDSTEFHNVSAFGRTGELVAQYMKKGSQVFLEGRLQTRSWDGKDGEKKYRTEIIAETVQFGNRPGGAGASPATGAGSSSAKGAESASESAPDAPADKIDYPTEEINPDDIPF
jgi:single-strand DNA-binding protein